MRYTNQELEMRRRAQAVLDDAAASDWHRKRALGDLKRTEKTARARAAHRATQEAYSASPKRDIPPNGISPEAWAAEQERVRTFLYAIGGAPSATPKTPAAAPVPPPTEPMVASVAPRAATALHEKFCEHCRVPFDVCHCAKPKPTSTELAEVAALDAKNNPESADDLTPCPLCLIPRGRCYHSGRRNPTDQINFLRAQMMGQG